VSPLVIQNSDAYNEHWIQHWHRATFGADAWAIDLDLVGACHRCGAALYLIEATHNPDKSTRIMRSISAMTGLPAILVRHNDDAVIRATWQHAAAYKVRIGGEEELKDAIGDLRERHRSQCQKEATG
jgi:hypothetical protein